jgi:Domain of unknown function (DUF3598)
MQYCGFETTEIYTTIQTLLTIQLNHRAMNPESPQTPIESTPWDNMLKNVGEWEGSFTQFDLNGTELSNIPSHLKLEDLGNHQAKLTLKRDSPKHPEPLVQNYSSLSQGLLFCDCGAFSQGSLQYAPFSQFGGEFGHIWDDRRLRLVQLFTNESKPNTLTLIREVRSGTQAKLQSNLEITDLIGTWRGNATTYYPDWRTPTTFTSTLTMSQRDDRTLDQSLQFDHRAITTSGRIEGSSLFFEQSALKTQVLMLPDKASASFPLEIPKGIPFFLECGWMPEPNVRQRIIRSYDAKGEWVSLTRVVERRNLD